MHSPSQPQPQRFHCCDRREKKLKSKSFLLVSFFSEKEENEERKEGRKGGSAEAEEG